MTLVNIQINSLNHELYGAGVQAAIKLPLSYSDSTDGVPSTSCFVSFMILALLLECFDDHERLAAVSMFQLSSIGMAIVQGVLFIDISLMDISRHCLAATRALGRC